MRRIEFAAAAVAVLLGTAVSSAEALDARRALDDGFTLLAARRYEEAAEKFKEAAASAGAEGLDPAVAGYDRGLALLKAGKAAEAADVFADLLRSSDPRLRESAHYHRGLALATAADAAEGKGDPRKAVDLLEEALTAYESAMRIDPLDEDPKVNHELTSRKLARLRDKQQQERGGGQGDKSQAGDAGGGGRPPQEREQRQPEQREQPARQGSPEKEMRPDEARTLLDAMRQQELSQRSRTRPFRGERVPVEKNW